MKKLLISFLLIIILALVAGGCYQQPPAQSQATYDVEFTLETSMGNVGMAFTGVGGEIDGVKNPDLVAQPGDTIRIVLVNGDGMPHDVAIDELGIKSAMITSKGDTTSVVFEATEAGQFSYYCTVAGHRQAGMEGTLVVSEP